jgi:hypothetical protein
VRIVAGAALAVMLTYISLWIEQLRQLARVMPGLAKDLFSKNFWLSLT